MGGGWGLSEISDLTLIQIVFLVVTRCVEDCERVCVCGGEDCFIFLSLQEVWRLVAWEIFLV